MTTMMRSNSAPPDDPAIMAGQVLLRLGIAIFAIGVPCGAVVSRRLLFVLMPVAAVLMIAGSLLLPGTRQQLKRHLRIAFIMPLVMIPLFLIIWAGLSFIWTPYAGLAGERFLKSAGTILVATAAIACLPARIRASNSNLLAIGVAAAALAAVMVSIISPARTGSPCPARKGGGSRHHRCWCRRRSNPRLDALCAGCPADRDSGLFAELCTA